MSDIVWLFHGTKVINDVLETGRWYHDFFGSWVYEAQQLPFEDSHNSANLMGGTFSMEMLSPRSPNSESPSARFLKRHGNHFLNVAFWVKDVRGMAQRLLDKGVRVALPGGKQVRELPQEPFRYFLPHPKDAYGTLFEFIQEDPEFHDPRRRPWWTASYWRDRHPLGNEGLSHATVAVEDLDGAGRFYREVLGCKLVKEERNADLGCHSLFFEAGDVLMEVAAPTNPGTDMAKHLEVHGPIVYSFAFKVRDLNSVAKHCRAFGFDAIKRGAHMLEVGPEQAQGGVFRFTDAVLPGHPTFDRRR